MKNKMRIISYLFILELFFGFNGKWLVLGGVSIRHWLFVLTLLTVYGKALIYFLKKRKEIKDVSFAKYIKEELKTFKIFDYFLALFLVLHIIWIIIIPYMQRDTNPDALGYAVSSGLCITLMLLYFPAVYLLRNGQVQWKKYVKFVMGCCIALAILHPVLYVLETIQWQTDHTYYFMERVFESWKKIVNGRCESQMILMPKYSVRIIYSFSIFIVMSFYFIIGKKKKCYLVWALCNIVALLTTGTRSHSLAVIVGICVVCMLDVILHRWTKRECKKALVLGIGSLLFVLLVDSVAFRGMNVTRMLSSFEVSKEALEKGEAQSLTWENSDYSKEKEIRGTANSNATRILLIRSLWQQIKEHPILGHGFALQQCDMQGLNYVAKVGMVGVSLWIVFLAFLLKRVIMMEKRERYSALPAIYLVVSVLFDTQLQCVFGSLTMAAAVFLFLDLEYRETEQEILS